MNKPDYANEGDLCDAFATAIRNWRPPAHEDQWQWTVYPEVAGWDLVLVHPDGTQIGVEAKMRCNLEVVAETLARTRYRNRPDYVAVLVPKASQPLKEVCHHLKILTFDAVKISRFEKETAAPKMWSRLGIILTDPFLTKDPERLSLPPIPLQSGGGRPNPHTLSAWRVGALRILIRIKRDGYVTS